MAVRTGRTVGESLWGAAQIVVHVPLSRPLRRWRTTWGATPAEVAAALPGDELVPHPVWTYTHAIAVAAPPAAVWPWVVQVGQGRGGFYSYEKLEDLVGCRITNTDRVLPEHQDLQVGDEIRLHPAGPPLHVRVVEPERALVTGPAPGEVGAEASSWGWHLRPGPAGTTRLLERGRTAHGPSAASRLLLGPTLLEPISFVMSRKMLRTVAALAERDAGLSAAPGPRPRS